VFHRAGHILARKASADHVSGAPTSAATQGLAHICTKVARHNPRNSPSDIPHHHDGPTHEAIIMTVFSIPALKDGDE